MSREILQDIINDFNPDKFTRFFREKNRSFAPRSEYLKEYNDTHFKNGLKYGEISFSPSENLLVCAFQANQPLTERSGKKSQYEKGKKILKAAQADAGIFIFYDKEGNFRFSLIYPETIGNRRKWSNFRRFTYFVSREFTNKTFLQRIGDSRFLSLEQVREAFSLSAVTDIFYKDFFAEYSKLVEVVKKRNKIVNQEKVRDFVLLFAIRTIFLGFIQKKGWIGNDERFMQNLLIEYEKNFSGKDLFYKKWLDALFFKALSSAPGKKVAYGDNDFSEQTTKKLQMAPYLNGGLFKVKPDYDDQGYFVPDKEIKNFFDFLFSHNFTIEENSYEDEDLQLNPEFLGIIFERLVNKADGAVYTPRTEVDLMCRLSLVKWLEKNMSLSVSKSNLYELFFREGEKEEDQKGGSFSEKEIKEILKHLESLTICDPAVGSGAFLVGMMQVLDEIELDLKERIKLKDDDAFERKKRIIAQSLYGVEVKEWAVWICQLRLWLSLFIEAPDNMKNSLMPILPSLDFKVRQGDSLVQRVGSKTFPVLGHALMGEAIKRKVTQLKNLKNEYFGNKSPMKDWEVRQKELTIYEQILESEISEKQKEMNRLRGIKPEKQASLFGDEFFQPTQKELDFDKEKLEGLKSEINELIDQKQSIRKDKPLIWNIEFAEIFVEKGGFDVVIGNPPYVRQEDISDPTGKIKDKKQYKQFLIEMVKLDFPSNFPPKSKIKAQSDLYAYFYIRALRLLNTNGIHTFICSNSWLDVGYGVWLQKFLLERAPIECIIDNHAKRSFEASDVNTVVSVIHAPQKKVNKEHIIKFVAFKKPFEESIFTEYLLKVEEGKEILSNEIFRVYPITVRDTKEAGTEYEDEAQEKMKLGNYIGDKWGGKYLRAPDIFFKILEKGKGKLVRLGDIADVRFGIKTGADNFFYLKKNQVSALRIEKEFLTPILISSDQVKTYETSADDTEIFLASSGKSKAEIKGTNFLDYVRRGEKEKFRGRGGSSVPSNRPSCKSHRPFWYSINIPPAPPIYWMEMRRERYFTLFNRANLIADHTFYGIYPYEGIDSYTLCALLNTTLTSLFVEVFANDPGGGGTTLQTPTSETKRHVFLPSSLIGAKVLADSFRMLSKRASQSILNECGFIKNSGIREQELNPLPDRAKLDKLVFDVLDLTKDERKEVYRAVCRLVWNRVSKAKSV